MYILLHFEQVNINNAALEKKPLFWERAEDDVICIWQHGREEADKFLTFLNSIHARINWTSEVEKNSVLPFLDMNLQRVGNKIETSVYRKPTHTLKYSNFRSNRPRFAKLNNIKSLLFRAHNLCEEGPKKDLELSLISDAFIACEFPVNEVDRIIENYQATQKKEEVENQNDLENNCKIFLPYIPKVSDQLRAKLKKENVDVVFLRGRTVGQWLCNNKPKNVPVRWKNKIYKVPCECGRFYIGETSQWWDDREKQHKVSIRTGDLRNSFASHVESSGHEIKWEAVEFLDAHKYDKNRKIKEALYINAFSSEKEPILNLELGSKIDPIWNSLNSVIREFSFSNSFRPSNST
jgi:hypothetical protein